MEPLGESREIPPLRVANTTFNYVPSPRGPKGNLSVTNTEYNTRPKSTIAHNSHLPWIGTFDVVKSNDSVLQIQDENGKREWVHRAHVRRIIPRPVDLNYYPLPPMADTRTTNWNQPPEAPIVNQNRTVILADQSPQQVRTFPKRSNRGQIPPRFKDFIM